MDRLRTLDVKLSAQGERLRCNAPQGVLTSALRMELARRKPELMAWLRQGGGEAPGPGPLRIVPAAAERHQPFPLTDIQQAYWIGRGGELELGNVAPHFYTEVDFEALDLERLEAVLRLLIARHDMLRAVVSADGFQRILPEVPAYEVGVLDLRGERPETAAAALAETRERLSHQVLDAGRWPLFEIRASRLPDGRVRLHLSLDLLIGDAWSFQIFFRELFGLYADPGLELPRLELSFRDYVLAELSFRGSARYRRAESYWRHRLADLPGPPELPLLKSPGAVERPRFVRFSHRLEREVWQRLKQRGASAGLTPSGLLLAAFAEVLAAWSKNPRFVINLTQFNRLPLHPQVDRIMGDFSSTLLLAVEAGPGPFLERARHLQQQLWRDLEHAEVSGVRVMRRLAAREGAMGAGMPVVFTSTLRQAEDRPLPPGPSWELAYSISQTPQVWLDHRVTEDAGALAFNWDAVEELFPPGLLDDMFAAYRGLLDRLAAREESWEEPAGLERMSALLPPYMVPSELVFLDALPMSTTGKVDRKALAEPRARQGGSPFAAPRTTLEIGIAEVLREVLALAKVGLHDNFIELGATSIQLIQFRNRLCARLGIDVPVLAMFNHPNIASLAAHLDPDDPAGPGDGDRAEELRAGHDRLRRRREAMEGMQT